MALAARAGREAAEEQLGRDVPFSLLLVVYYSDHRQREVAKERQGCGGTRLKTVLKRVREELVQPIFQQRPRADAKAKTAPFRPGFAIAGINTRSR